MPANLPRGLFGKTNVLYVSIAATVKPSAAIAIAVHEAVNSETTNAQLAATAGLRKNLNVSKPSIGASFHAPPNAEIQPAPMVSWWN